MSALDNLAQAVTDNGTAIAAAITAGIGTAAGVPEADVQAQADLLTTQTARLVAATPAPSTEPVAAPADGGGTTPEVSGNPPA